jgi:prepilin-type N-terminal cleavage/methylation domain-containing protein
MIPAKRAPRRASGYTLLETLVVMIIFAIVLAMTTTFVAGATRVFSRETRAVDLQGDLAGTVSVLLDDLSIAGYGVDASTNPFDPSTSIGSSLDTVEFLGDIDSDGDADRICYSVTSGALGRSVQEMGQACGTNAAETLATNVQSFDLSFLGQTATNGTTRAALTEAQTEALGKRCASAAPSGPCYIQVRMVVQAAAKGGNVTKTIAGEAAIRN